MFYSHVIVDLNRIFRYFWMLQLRYHEWLEISLKHDWKKKSKIFRNQFRFIFQIELSIVLLLLLFSDF